MFWMLNMKSKPSINMSDPTISGLNSSLSNILDVKKGPKRSFVTAFVHGNVANEATALWWICCCPPGPGPRWKRPTRRRRAAAAELGRWPRTRSRWDPVGRAKAEMATNWNQLKIMMKLWANWLSFEIYVWYLKMVRKSEHINKSNMKNWDWSSSIGPYYLWENIYCNYI